MELVVTLQCWKVYAFDNVDRNAFWSSLVWIYNTYMYPWSNSLQWHKDSASRSSWYYWRCFRRKGAREAGWNPVSWFSYWLYHPKFLANPKKYNQDDTNFDYDYLFLRLLLLQSLPILYWWFLMPQRLVAVWLPLWIAVWFMMQSLVTLLFSLFKKKY